TGRTKRVRLVAVALENPGDRGPPTVLELAPARAPNAHHVAPGVVGVPNGRSVRRGALPGRYAVTVVGPGAAPRHRRHPCCVAPSAGVTHANASRSVVH